MPLLPDTQADQKASFPIPFRATTPKPLMTTRASPVFLPPGRWSNRPSDVTQIVLTIIPVGPRNLFRLANLLNFTNHANIDQYRGLRGDPQIDGILKGIFGLQRLHAGRHARCTSVRSAFTFWLKCTNNNHFPSSQRVHQARSELADS